MRTLKIKIPETVDFDDKELLLTISSILFEKGRLSLGQAAEMAGLSKGAFMDILGTFGISVINHPASDLDRDVENASNYNS